MYNILFILCPLWSIYFSLLHCRRVKCSRNYLIVAFLCLYLCINSLFLFFLSLQSPELQAGLVTEINSLLQRYKNARDAGHDDLPTSMMIHTKRLIKSYGESPATPSIRLQLLRFETVEVFKDILKRIPWLRRHTFFFKYCSSIPIVQINCFILLLMLSLLAQVNNYIFWINCTFGIMFSLPKLLLCLYFITIYS